MGLLYSVLCFSIVGGMGANDRMGSSTAVNGSCTSTCTCWHIVELKRLHVVVEMKCNQQVAQAGADCVSNTKASCRDLVSGRCIVQWSLTLACYAMLQVYNAWGQARIHG